MTFFRRESAAYSPQMGRAKRLKVTTFGHLRGYMS